MNIILLFSLSIVCECLLLLFADCRLFVKPYWRCSLFLSLVFMIFVGIRLFGRNLQRYFDNMLLSTIYVTELFFNFSTPIMMDEPMLSITRVLR